jgi:diaminopimelate decarboxylase
MIEARNGHVTFSGMNAEELAERFGTPLFVYDAATVRETYRRIRAAIRHQPSRVHYAAVCNPNLQLLRVLRDEGAGLHANTPGDVYCGLRAGYAAEDIVFSGSNLGPDDVDYLVTAGVHVNVDSLDDLRLVCARAPGRPVGLRIHLEDVLPESRIGLREPELEGALAIARAFRSPITDLHVYCGTHGQKLGLWAEAVRRLAAIAQRIPDLRCLNLGGGFGYDYRDPEGRPFPFEALAGVAEEAVGALASRLARPIALRAEPGRALVAGAGVLLTRIRSTKAGKSVRYVGVDTTVSNFTSPVVHGPHRRVVAPTARGAEAPTTVCGCTTYSRDFVARDVALPELAVGDLLAVLDVGAYGYCMASHFLNRPKPAEVFVDRGVARLVTRRETFADLVRAQLSSVA